MQLIPEVRQGREQMQRIAVGITILVALCVFVFSWVLWSEFWITDRCLDAGGAWDSEAGECRGVEGFEDRQWSVGPWMFLVGFPAGLAIVSASVTFYLLGSLQSRIEAKSA